ncbi:MAG: hypothetical protein QWI36_00420 [Wolbachia endosymbiont of Tyrophagus putrescentiae]|nr:hypothetical protein [Wolbachia endosymbiont of Tyrophagus putrescentiae]
MYTLQSLNRKKRLQLRLELPSINTDTSETNHCKIKLSDNAPIFGTWVPRSEGADFPDGNNSNLDYVGVIVDHILNKNEDREYYLILNGPGFRPGQIDGIKAQFGIRLQGELNRVHIIDLHQYDWSEVDKGWKIDGKDISIKKYFEDMYSMDDEMRTYPAIEFDSFRMIAHALFPQIVKKYEGAIYIDHDTLRAMEGPMGKNITIPEGILVGTIYNPGLNVIFANNDLIAIDDAYLAAVFLFTYNGGLLSQRTMCDRIRQEHQFLSKSKINTVDKLLSQFPLLNSTEFLINVEKGIITSHVEFQKLLLCTALELMENRRESTKNFDFKENNGRFPFAIQHDLSWKEGRLFYNEERSNLTTVISGPTINSITSQQLCC